VRRVLGRASYQYAPQLTGLQKEPVMAVTKDSVSKLKDKGPCWKDYEAVGMKPAKGGKMVPNCVPKKKKKDDK